jgi:hypothetical protein
MSLSDTNHRVKYIIPHVFNVSIANLSQNLVFCGGETSGYLASFGNTRCGNGGSSGLLYRGKVGSTYVWYSWGGYFEGEDPPYEVVAIDNNNFQVTGND